MPASGLLSSCATPETSCPIADIFSDWMSCSCSIFWSVTSRDRKSTRLNSSHDQISYAVFCLKKKKKKKKFLSEILTILLHLNLYPFADIDLIVYITYYALF